MMIDVSDLSSHKNRYRKYGEAIFILCIFLLIELNYKTYYYTINVITTVSSTGSHIRSRSHCLNLQRTVFLICVLYVFQYCNLFIYLSFIYIRLIEFIYFVVPVRCRNIYAYPLVDGIFNYHSRCLPLDALSIHSFVLYNLENSNLGKKNTY